MKGSLYLGSVFGIRLQVHWTFLLIIIWAIIVGWRSGGTSQAVFWMIGYVLAIFACVVLHEFGHALTARHYHIATRKITLLPIGGVASLARMPEEPRQELLVAMMGPAVNVAIAGLLYFFVRAQFPIFQDAEAAKVFFQSVNADNFLLYLFITNIALVVFNVIPAFPMDGGRILRALLSFKMDRVRATEIAANLGQVIAVLFFVIGLTGNIILVFIGVFVFFGASGEYMMVRQMSMLKGHRVREAMMSVYTVFKPSDTLEQVGRILLSGTEKHFVVTGNEDEVLGVLYKKKLMEAFQSRQKNLLVQDVMDRNYKQVGPLEELSEIYRTVQASPYNFFPVVENGKLAGVIDMENINEFMMIQATLDY